MDQSRLGMTLTSLKASSVFSGLNRHTAGPIIQIVEAVKAASLHLTRDMIGVRGEKVILRIPLEKSRLINQEMRDAGLIAKVEIELDGSPQHFSHTNLDERRAQKLLF